MSEIKGNINSFISVENGVLAYGSQAQWKGYALHESGCLNGNAKPLSMAAIFTSGNFTIDQSSCWNQQFNVTSNLVIIKQTKPPH